MSSKSKLAIASAALGTFLIPSMAAGRRLVCEAPLAADFVDHLPTVMSLASRWWRYPVLPPVLPTEGLTDRPRTGRLIFRMRKEITATAAPLGLLLM